MIYFITNNTEIPTEEDVYQMSSSKELIKWLEGRKEFQVDCETEFDRKSKKIADPRLQKMICLQIGDRDNQFVIDKTHEITFLRPYFEDESIIKIFVNAFFDLRYLIHEGWNIKNVYDCFLAERLLTLGKKMPKGYLGLQQMAKRYLDVDLSKEVRDEIEERGLDSTVIKYSAKDVEHLQDIKDKQLVTIKEFELETCLELENKFIITLARISYNGFRIDPVKWTKIYESNVKLLFDYQCKLNDWLLDNKHEEFYSVSNDELFPVYKFTLNWNSFKQVTKLFKKIGVDVTVRDKKKGGTKDSVEIKQLIKQKSKFEILPVYIKYKEIKKECSTYGEKFLKQHLNPVSKKVHSEFFPILDTGRISSSNPNLQNITATDDHGEVNPLRECFIPGEFNELIIADYQQQEPRVTAEYCQDPTLLDFIHNGDGDSHSLISSIISEALLGEKVKVSKKNNPLVPKYQQKIRDIGKMINLGLDYGKTAFSVKDDLGISQEEAQKLIDTIKNGFPLKEKYFEECIKFVKAHGYIVIDQFTKRRSYFNDYELLQELKKISYDKKTKDQISNFYKIQGQLERFAKNYPIQGTGGSMTKLASLIFEKRLEAENLSDCAWIVNLVHDEIVVESNLLFSEQVKIILEESMIKAGTFFCPTVPMKIDIFIRDSWKKE